MRCGRCGNPTGHVTRTADDVTREPCEELMRLIVLARKTRRDVPAELVRHATEASPDDIEERASRWQTTRTESPTQS